MGGGTATRNVAPPPVLKIIFLRLWVEFVEGLLKQTVNEQTEWMERLLYCTILGIMPLHAHIVVRHLAEWPD